MKVTMRDVAQDAGVAIGTVSRVLRDDPTVQAYLSKKVLHSARSLDYQRLRRERGATSSHPLRGKTIGIMLLGMGPSLAASPLVGMALDGVRRELSGEEALLQILDIPDPSKPNASLERSRVDAWLVKGSNVGNIWKESHPSIRKRLQSRQCVWFHGKPEGANGDYVGTDETTVGDMAAEALAETGHQQVAFITTRREQRLLKQREIGFKAGCRKRGLRCHILAASVDEQSFPLEKPDDLPRMKGLLERLHRLKPRPTAAFVPADSLAILLYQAINAMGWAAGRDLDVISANGEWPLIVGLNPALTTVNIESEQIGSRAVQQLASRFTQSEKSPDRQFLLTPRLHLGGSLSPRSLT